MGAAEAAAIAGYLAGWGPAAFAAAYSSSVLKGGRIGPSYFFFPGTFSNSLTLVDLWIIIATSSLAPWSITCLLKDECAPRVVKLSDCVSRLSYPKNFFFFKVKSIFLSLSPIRTLFKFAVYILCL